MGKVHWRNMFRTQYPTYNTCCPIIPVKRRLTVLHMLHVTCMVLVEPPIGVLKAPTHTEARRLYYSRITVIPLQLIRPSGPACTFSHSFTWPSCESHFSFFHANGHSLINQPHGRQLVNASCSQASMALFPVPVMSSQNRS